MNICSRCCLLILHKLDKVSILRHGSVILFSVDTLTEFRETYLSNFMKFLQLYIDQFLHLRSIFTMIQVFFNGFKCNFNCDFFATCIFFMSDIDYLDNISKQHEKGKTQRQSSDLKSTIHYATFFSATVCSNWKLHGQTCEHIQTANHSCNQ